MRSVKIKIRNLVILFFSLILTLAVFSEVTAQPTTVVGSGKSNTYNPASPTGGLTPSDWLYHKSSNDLSAYLGKKSSKLPTVRYQKGSDYLEFSMAGAVYSNLQPTTYNLTPVSSTTSVSLETNIKQPNTPTLFYRNIFDNIDANYQITNVPFKIKEEIILKSKISNLKSKNLTFVFDAKTSAKPVKQDDGSIAFFGDNGEYLFQLDKPFMVDAKGTISNDVNIDIVSIETEKENKKDAKRHRKSFDTFDMAYTSNFQLIFNDLILKHLKTPPFKIQNLPVDGQKDIKRHRKSFDRVQSYQIILKADTEWLSQATYPVIIDPTVTHNADANFTGQMNRIADNDSTSSTQLESSYPEATKDPYTVLLLHFNEANGSAGTTIKDYASTTRVITANGNASTTNSVTQLGMGNSAAFDGTGDYLSLPDDASLDFAAADNFTIDFWIKHNTIATNPDYAITKADATTGGYKIYMDASGDMCFDIDDDGTWTPDDSACTSGIDYDNDAWHHVAGVKTGTTRIELFVDGVLVASDSALAASGSLANTNGFYVGMDRDGSSNGWDGQIDEARVISRALTPEEIKATASRRPYAVYTSSVLDATASTSWNTLNWTEGGVNTGDGEQPYSANSLVAQWDFNDTSGTTLTASSSGSCTTACNGTLTNFAYTASQDQATTTTGWTANNKKWGAGALMFDGSNDWVSVPDNADWHIANGDFTIEAWVNFNKVTSSQTIVSQYNSGDNHFYFQYSSSGVLRFYYSTLGVGQSDLTSPWNPSVGKWYHLAAVRSGNDGFLYINGVRQSSTLTGWLTHSDVNSVLKIGFFDEGSAYLNGTLDSLRIYKGRALSADEILSNYNAGNIEIQTRTGATSDPNDGTWEAWKPTTGETQLLSMDSDQGNWNAPQQIDGYTKLLLHMDGTDTATTFPNSATTTHTVTANGNAQVDTAQSKFSGGSALFDGTTDYLSIPDSDDWYFGSGDFTIDGWVRWNSLPTSGIGYSLFEQYDSDGAKTQFALHGDAGLWLNIQGVGSVSQGSIAGWSINRWYHVAAVRSGNTFTLYKDGVAVANMTNTGTLPDRGASLKIGPFNNGDWGWFNGHLDELRISKGIARWTSNFTPPPRAYGSNVKADNETTLKMEGTASAKLTLGAPQVDGNTVALWHFEETGTTTGTYLYDETANNNDATTTGTTVVDGIFGKARSFNGTSDYVTALALTGGTAVQSVSFWVYPLTTTEYFVDLNGTAYVWANAGTVTATGFTSPTIYVNGAVSSVVAAGQWQHIAVTTGTGINASAPNIGKTPTNNFLEGKIDEVQISNRALSADEIAETYRMGANHHLTRQVSATDLSSANKLAFNVAADRPGTYLETMLGESDYANYELASSTLALSTTTVLYIKANEIASSTSIKDSSFSGKAITANDNARTAGGGKIGNSVYFDGTGDYLSVPDDASLDFAAADNFTIDFWIKHNTIATNPDYAITKADATTGGYKIYMDASGDMCFDIDDDGTWTPDDSACTSGIDYDNNAWHHVAGVKTGTTKIELFVDGVLVASDATLAASGSLANTNGFYAGMDRDGSSNGWDGYIDEARVIGTALTPDQIRQAYEYGLRTHPITIDFGATLQTSDLISNSTDYNFNITATTSGLSATTSGLYLGDKIVIKENLGGTEYTAQGTVNAINTTTGAITVPSWDTGSTFPASNGYSPNATVFKWQREYFDLTGAATTTRNAITNLTLRPTNGAEGRTIYLDDFRYNTNYLTASSSSAITSSNNRYLQYRAIFSSWDSFVSPYLSAINTLYTALANSFPAIIGVSGGGFLSF